MTPGGRRAVVVALAEEMDDLQQQDRQRIEAYSTAAEPYLAACRHLPLSELSLAEAHAELCAIAERLLPPAPLG